MTTASTAAPPRSPGRWLLWLGLGVAILGVIGIIVQLKAHLLRMPWYLPCSGTLGVFFLAAALWQARSLWRVLAMIFLVLLAGAEWTVLLTNGLPAYTGPVATGQRFLTFATKRADGSSFTQSDLAGDRNNVLVFFRGRW